MAKGSRKCIICGSEYTYCPKCGNGDKEETWRYLYDTELCNNIFDGVSSFSHGHIKKEEAKTKLEALKIPKGMKFNTEIKNQIDTIMASEPKAKEKQIVKEED
jgi:hypothetical protein